MGYYLQAFAGKTEDLSTITAAYSLAVSIPLSQGISLIPLTEELFDQINRSEDSPGIAAFDYLTENIEAAILQKTGTRTIAYIEAEYFGGEGGQQGLIWRNGERSNLYPYTDGRINDVFASLGVVPEPGSDIFDTLNLGRHRHTREWIETRD